MSVQGSTSSTPINQVDQTLVSQENVSGVKENKPPMFLKTISNKLKRGFNNLVLSHNKRVVARAYRSYRPSKSGRIINNKKVYNKINSSNLKDQALNLKFVNTLKGKDLKAFFKVFKSELLKTDNKAFFNNLLPEAKKAFIEQNKGDVEFLSVFSNVYKEELAYDSFGGGTMPELLTAFKDAIISNKDQIIKDPTILAYADKATLESIIESIIKGDEELGKALIQSFFTIDGAFVEKALTAEIKETGQGTFSDMKATEEKLLKFFNNKDLQSGDYGLGESVQALADAARGYGFIFEGPNGGRIIIEGGLGKSRPDLLRDVRDQVNKGNFSKEDINALSDFLAHCPAQGLIAARLGNRHMHIEGDNHPMLTVNYSQDSNATIGLKIKGKTEGTTCSITIGNKIAVINPETNAEIVFTYPKSIGECKGKASNIEVNHFEQKIGDVTFLT